MLPTDTRNAMDSGSNSKLSSSLSFLHNLSPNKTVCEGVEMFYGVQVYY